MGILKNLTDEYFGKKVRTEDRIISTYLKKCIDSNKRDLFIKMNKGWGEDGKTILLYEKDVTLIGEAKIITPEEAVEFFKQGNNTFKTDYRCLHIENFMATPDTYKVNTFDILPESIQKPLTEMFELYCKYPETISFFTHIIYNYVEDMSGNIFPGELCDYKGDEYFECFDDYEDGDDVVEFITTDGCFFCYDDEKYSSEWGDIFYKISEAFRIEGFKESSDMCDITSSEKRFFFGKIKK